MFEPVLECQKSAVFFFSSFRQLSEISSFHCARQIKSQEYLREIQTVFFPCWMSGAVVYKYTVCSKQYLRMDSMLFDYPDRLLHSKQMTCLLVMTPITPYDNIVLFSV